MSDPAGQLNSLKYRHYQPGDERGLANLFNRAFQTNGAGNIRVTKSQRWRYPQNPHFDARQINLCEDPASGQIVGAIMSEAHEILIRGAPMVMGTINDVSTDPTYMRRGIARKLLDMANDYFIEHKIDHSMLVADPRGHPRKYLYLPDGYFDFMGLRALAGFPSVAMLAGRDLPFFIGLSPIVVAAKYSKLILRKLQALKLNLTRDYHIETRHTPKTPAWDFWDAWKTTGLKYYDWFLPCNREYWKWARVRVPYRMFRPTHVMLRHGDENGDIMAGATLTLQPIHSFQFQISVANLKDFFVDFSKFPRDIETRVHLMDLFVIQLLKAAAERRASLLLFMAPENDQFAINSFRRVGFLPVPAGVVMVKHRRDSRLETPRKPLYIPPNEAMGFP